MLHIALCDDDKTFSNDMGILLKQYWNDANIDYGIQSFASGEELIACKEEFDLYFIDYIMNGLNGIETAKQLRNNGITSPIVFLTNYREAIQEAFTVRAYRYLMKENYRTELLKCLEDFQSDYCTCEIISLDKNKGFYVVYTRNIQYITSSHNGTELWTIDGLFKSSRSLNEWYGSLDKSMFFRSHKNSIVNLGYIKKVEGIIELTNGEHVELSRRNRKGLKEALLKYINTYSR